jgi:hypothetical protein
VFDIAGMNTGGYWPRKWKCLANAFLSGTMRSDSTSSESHNLALLAVAGSTNCQIQSPCRRDCFVNHDRPSRLTTPEGFEG